MNDVRILEFPANGQRFYGTQRSRPAWNADFAELWDLRPADGGVDTRDTGRELGGHATVRRRWRSSPST